MTSADIQDIPSLVFSGHARLMHTLAVGIIATDPAAAKRTLREILPEFSFGIPAGRREKSLHLLLSATGVAILGSSAALATFSAPFCEGIATPQRSRALGDHAQNDPATWSWRDRDVHAVLLIYAATPEETQREHARLRERLGASWHGVFALPIHLPGDEREPFGFRDGLTNIRIDTGDTKATADGIDTVPPGEVLLGHPDQLGVTGNVTELAKNGTYVVLRQLAQDVEGFWKFWQGEAKSNDEAVALAAKAVGRWPNGMPVREAHGGKEPPPVEAEIKGPLSFDADRNGRGCPFGAHIRRANPRDALVADAQRSRELVAQHRILRRGRAYGPLDETAERGLLFMALCADIARQFEFIQQTWLNNPKFADLYDEVDPITAGRDLLQDSRRFSIPADPVRRRIHALQHWVTVRGGGYFFMPGKKGVSQWLEGG